MQYGSVLLLTHLCHYTLRRKYLLHLSSWCTGNTQPTAFLGRARLSMTVLCRACNALMDGLQAVQRSPMSGSAVERFEQPRSLCHVAPTLSCTWRTVTVWVQVLPSAVIHYGAFREFSYCHPMCANRRDTSLLRSLLMHWLNQSNKQSRHEAWTAWHEVLAFPCRWHISQFPTIYEIVHIAFDFFDLVWSLARLSLLISACFLSPRLIR